MEWKALCVSLRGSELKRCSLSEADEERARSPERNMWMPGRRGSAGLFVSTGPLCVCVCVRGPCVHHVCPRMCVTCAMSVMCPSVKECVVVQASLGGILGLHRISSPAFFQWSAKRNSV